MDCGNARFTALPQETVLKSGPFSSRLENTPSECIPNRREPKVADPHRVELNQLECDRPIASFLWLRWPDCRWRRRIREVQLSGSAVGQPNSALISIVPRLLFSSASPLAEGMRFVPMKSTFVGPM